MTCPTCTKPGITDPRYAGWVFDSYQPNTFGNPYGPVVVFKPCPDCGVEK